MSSTPSSLPQRGEVWKVSFDPTVGAEIRKTRPAVVISSDAVGRLPIKLVVPITDWKPAFAPNIWHVRIDPDPTNGLTKPSARQRARQRPNQYRKRLPTTSRLAES
ncbi:MAG: type II toxin-antitoxin system PemK/MazF family toxin [Planctomycetota bacterium]